MFRGARWALIIGLVVSIWSGGWTAWAAPDPTNGVAYVLLPRELDLALAGVYRLNAYASPYAPLLAGIRMFDLNFSSATVVNGLAVNQQNQVYLFVGPNTSGTYAAVDEEGWLPSGLFDPDSPAFVKLIGQPFDAGQISQDITGPMPNRQYPHGTTNYDNDFWDYGPWPASPHYPSGWPHTHAKYTQGSFTDASGKPYSYLFQPINPPSHANTPLWNGPGGSAAGIAHPSDPYKVILPNKWGGISWYAFGTTKAPPTHIKKLMDGKDGRPVMTNQDFRLLHDNTPAAGQVPLMSPYWDASYISTVVKRIYERRERSLDLYSYLDDIIPPVVPPYSRYPGCDAAGVLTATDLKITEMYGKTCGDGCIPGGPLPAEAIAKIESVVQVFTATTGRRYGFNPYGKKIGPYGANDAALRVVHSGVNYNLELNTTNVNNKDYLASLGVDLDKITRMGVSSKFETPGVPITRSPDLLYGSVADKFVIQDSWWGIGGVAYEYYGHDFTAPSGANFKKGHIYRLDYLDKSVPTPDDVGEFKGAVDSIGVDGEGNLYILFTELDWPNDPVWPDPLGLPKAPVIAANWPNTILTGDPRFLGVTGWMRPGIGTSDSPIPGPSQVGDYVDFTVKQNVRKVARRYTPSAGGGFSASTVEDRGAVDASFDAISRKLEYAGVGTYTWGNEWHHDVTTVSDRKASLQAEFAVVNIAAKPQVYNGPSEATYSICRNDTDGSGSRVSSKVPVTEGQQVTFKVEGFKPYGADGNRQGFRSIGNVPGLGNTSVNLIPPFENRDEDGDGIMGGFPSSLFESAVHNPQFAWFVELIDSTDPNCDNSKVLKSFFETGTSGTGADFDFTFKFPQPGNYRIYVRMKYPYFDYNKLAMGERPSDLAKAKVDWPGTTPDDPTRGIIGGWQYSQKVLYQVQADTSTKKEHYITNIQLTNQGYLQDVDPVSGGGITYDLPENASPTGMTFTFDARFVQEFDRNNPDVDFSTCGGVGVWDYNDPDGHVYNYVDANTHNDAYNPGWGKPENPALANHGTRVDADPSAKDLAAIKWRLYLYPTYDGAPANFTAPAGLLVGEGDCSTLAGAVTQVTPAPSPHAASARVYRIPVRIPGGVPPINTPIDPGTYRLRLELQYPRVKWYEYRTGPEATDIQHHSIVKDDDPIGVVTTVPGTDDGIAWSSDPDIFPNGDSWQLRARDTVFTAPVITEPTVLPIIQTTGDPIATISVKYTLNDNNPNVQFPAGGETGVWYEFPAQRRDPTLHSDSEGANPDGAPGPFPAVPEFYASDTYQISANYKGEIAKYGVLFAQADPETDTTSYQNWVGSLTFSIIGRIQDGYGASSPLDLGTYHNYVATPPAPSNHTDIQSQILGVERYDNDPPSLHASIVSQADNRFWAIVLKEEIRDSAPNPTTVAQLAKTTISIACYRLDDLSTPLLATQSIQVDGSSNFNPGLDGNKDVFLDETHISTLPDPFKEVLPRVRRSGRILVNFDCTDNVDYKAFGSASVDIVEGTVGTGKSLVADAPPPIPLEAVYSPVGDATLNTTNPPPSPRARFTADMPMRVKADQTEPSQFQVGIRLQATDNHGNQRSLTIPVRIVDSTFDARVLESKENRK